MRLEGVSVVRIRAALVVATAGALLMGGVFAPGASARPLRCQSLKGERVKGPRNMKIVVQESESGSKATVFACLTPNGPVHAAGSVTGLGEFTTTLKASKGDWIAVSLIGELGLIGEEIGTVLNVANGKSYRYWKHDSAVSEKPEDVGLDRFLLGPSGQSALAQHEGSTEQIVGFQPSGKRRVLASGPTTQIPPRSLALKGQTVEWLESGVTRSASL